MRILAAALSLYALFAFDHRGVLHGRPIVWTATGGASGAGGGAGTGGAAGGAGTGTGGAAGSTGGASGAGGGVGCGDGVVQPGEYCDGSDLQGATCAFLGFTGGSLACSSTCQFDVSSCTGGTITPTVVASRTSCKAPCSVFFDATSTTGLSGSSPTPGGGTFSGDYVAANWFWDFNDTASTHKKTIGFAVAHVFDNPGTYNVRVFVRDLAGAAGFATQTITVSAMSGTTYYVSTSGSDGLAGTSPATAFATIAHALSVGGSANNTVLLRNGDVFTLSASADFTAIISIGITGPFRLGAYVDPAHVSATKPKISMTHTGQFSDGIGVDSSSDVRFTDFAVDFTDTAHASCNAFRVNNTTNFLAERLDVTFNSNGGACFNDDGGLTYFTVADSNLHDFTGSGGYLAEPQGSAWIGNAIANYTTNNHAIRIQGAPNGVGVYATGSYIAENNVVPNAAVAGGFGDITERGDNTKFVLVNNVMTAAPGTCFQIQPQNGSSVEHVINGLVEGNTCIAPGTPMQVVARHVYVRNNVFNGADSSIFVLGEAQMPTGWTTQVFLLNNTSYQSDGSLGPDTYFARLQTLGSGTVTFANNILWTSHTSTTSSIYTTDGTGTITNSGHNLLYAPNAGTQTASNVGTGGLSASDPKFVTNGSNFHLQSTSPARNAGLTSTSVYSDPSCVMRPKESVWDIGAYEYKP